MSEIWSTDGRITEREKLKYSIAKVSQCHFATVRTPPSGVVKVYLQIHILIFHIKA
jgi:hypothetical protein